VGAPPGSAKPRLPIHAAAWLIFFAVVLTVGLIASAGKRFASSPTGPASNFIRQNGADASAVQTSAADVMSVMALVVSSPTASNTRYLVQIARQARDAIDRGGNDFVKRGQNVRLGAVQAKLFTAATELGNTMGAIAAYAAGGFTWPLADLISRYQRARRHWNRAVSRIWSVAGQGSVPSLS
jgi:hypothetical protein